MIEKAILLAILLASRAFDVPAHLIAAVIDQESGFNVNALGDYDEDKIAHSFSLMQVNDKGAGHGYTPDMLLNPAFNIMVGTEYLKACMNAFPNNLRLAISAYNQGIGGASEKGWGANRTYVLNVLSLMSKYEEELK
jgi:soluble lytic murein transglycosylase